MKNLTIWCAMGAFALLGCEPSSSESNEDASATDIRIPSADTGASDGGLVDASDAIISPVMDAMTMMPSDIGTDTERGDVGAEAPLPEECEPACDERARRSFAACIRGGTDEETCAEIIEQRLEDCRALCNEQPSTPCEMTCAEVNETAIDACVATGMPRDQCRQTHQTDLLRCRADCEGTENDDCPTRCGRRADAIYDFCMRQVGDMAVCEGARQTEVDGCLAECDGAAMGCETGCENEFGPPIQQCIDAGRPRAACEERFGPPLQECIENCRECLMVCTDRAREIEESCLARGQDPADCQRLAAGSIETCAMDCNGEDPCRQECDQRADASFEACRARGGAEDLCRRNADNSRERCYRACGGDDGPRPVPAPGRE